MSEFDDLAIPRVSPTSAEDLLKCRSRALRKGHRAVFVETPTLALGNACHAISEMVYRGQFDSVAPTDLRIALREAFDNEIDQRRAAMVEASAGRDVPIPRRWRNYQAIRSRLPRFLEAEVALRREGRAPTPLAVEERLESQDGVIFGYPDRVERDGHVIRIVDLKSGLMHPDGIPDAYRRQLMVYCYLWHERTGDWPSEAAVQRMDGQLEPIDVNPDQISDLIGSIRSRRDEANTLVQAGGDESSLADPSPEVCQWCRRRPHCAAFIAAVDESYTLGGPCVFGTVEAEIRADGQNAIDISITASNLGAETESVRVIGVALDAVPEVGSPVAVMDARATSKPGQVSLSTWSVLSAVR